MRGQQHTRVDGSIIRPSLVLLDDPQTRDSARSVDQTRKRLELLNGDVLGMAGPGEQISALMTCTKMYEGDLADTVLDRDKCPEWDSECTRLVYAFPASENLWEEYGEVRRAQGKVAASEFYRERQAAMDEGAQIAWPHRFDGRSGEISAVQHAVNLKLKVGPEAFAAEYQNEPAMLRGLKGNFKFDGYYVTKPFSVRQLLARANAFLRRRRQGAPDAHEFAGYRLDLSARRLTRGGREIVLTPKEFALLAFFLLRPGRALTRDEILRHVWGHGVFVTTRSVDRCVNTLRGKLEADPARPKLIHTVHQIGYRFEQ